MKAIVAQKQFRLIQSMVLCASIFVLPACVSKPPEELAQQTDEALSNNTRAARERSVREVPADVRAQLRQGIDLQQSSVRQLLEEPRFSIQARDMAASDFFAQLTAETPYSVVVHPDVRGAITVNLRDVTLQEALNVVQDIFGYDIRKEGRIYRVFPAGLRTETLSLNYLSLRRQGISQTQITSGGVAAQGTNNQGGINNSRQNNNYSGSDLLGNQGIQNGQSGANIGTTGQSGSSISTTNETDFWKELESILQGIIGEGNGRPKSWVSPQAGLANSSSFPRGEISCSPAISLSSAESKFNNAKVVLEAPGNC